MSDVILDLKNEGLFINDELELTTNISFLYGKNGTGKSTLTSLFREQISDYDVRVFQGFEGVIGSNKKLNAVILGDENNKIDAQINNKQEEILEKKKLIEAINDNILESKSRPDNLWSRKQKKGDELTDQKRKIDNFCTRLAAKIKNISNPQVAGTSYNINNFKEDTGKATLLSSEEESKFKKTLSTSIKNAKHIPKIEINSQELVEEANKLLTRKVEAKVLIEEFSGNKEKEEFAKKGLKIHAVGDKCAFCGSEFTIERKEKIDLFFSADEVLSFENGILALIKQIDNKKGIFNNLNVDENDFYPENVDEAKAIKVELDDLKKNWTRFLDVLSLSLEEKRKSLYEVSNQVNPVLPVGLDVIFDKHYNLVEKNNKSELEKLQKQAKDCLKYHEVKKLIDEFKFDSETILLSETEKAYNQLDTDYKNEKEKINQIEKEIKSILGEIKDLQAKTKNEEKLANEINRKLWLYVNFQLVYMKGEDEKGYYQIKCNRTLETREIDKLSTGEKNIIAFLYFLEKLYEVNEGVQLPKLIVFDDPMNSNDDTMQYVIIEELQNLFPKVNKDGDKLVLLTHNSHFYLNAKYKIDSYKKNTFIHIISNGKQVEFKKIAKKEEDIKTNYGVLWEELHFLFNATEANPSMLLNPIRRIIETFSTFNAINKRDMLSTVIGAEKLFNVNSHSIEDLQAELNGRDKSSIIEMCEQCFVKSGSEEHFRKYWDKSI